jgi:chromosomal replication initiator protein
VQSSLWGRCVQQLRSDLPEQQFNTWIRPLQAVEEAQVIRLLAPNRFVVDWVNSNCLDRITDFLREAPGITVRVEVGSLQRPALPVGGKPAAWERPGAGRLGLTRQTDNSSTSNISVAFGGITPPAPRAP